MDRKYDFSGWATRNDLVCADGRTIRKDAFKHCDGKTVPLVWNHRHDEPANILGHALLENRADGVYAYCFFNETESGKAAKELVQHGDVESLSIYANGLKQTANRDVMHGDIKEVSLVVAGANPGAFIDFVDMAHAEEGSETEVIIGTGEGIPKGTIIPIGFALVLLSIIVMTIVLNKTKVGRYIIAIGSNKEAARLSGVNVIRSEEHTSELQSRI